MVDTFDLDKDPRHHRGRAANLRRWASQTSDSRIQAELRVLADEYDRLASIIEQRLALANSGDRRSDKIIDPSVQSPGPSEPDKKGS
jgi:hypothetical protein